MRKKKLIAIITLTISLSVVSSQLTYAVTNMEEKIDMVSDNETINDNGEQASVVPFTSRAHENFGDFQEKFMVSPSEIINYSNNGGKYSSSILDKAFDGNISTHWETGKPNSSSFINEVTVNFKEVETLDKIGYLVRQDTWSLKGFPLKFEIYSSMSDMGENFTLVSKGEYTANKNFIEINFKESQFKRLKFKFVTAKDNWASISELEFYRPDYVSKEVRNIFTDGTYSQLSEKYMNSEELAKIEELIMTHPYKDDYKEIIDNANELINNPGAFAKDLFNVEQRGSNTRNFSRGFEQIQPIGRYAVPGDVIKVFVEADDKQPLPSIGFFQTMGRFNKYKKFVNLRPGVNTIVVPESYDETWSEATTKGGPIYIHNPYTKDQQATAPKIRIMGGEQYPIYFEGGDEDKFIAELKTYDEKLKSDTTGRVQDIFEVVSDKMIVTGHIDGAKEAYIANGVKPSETTEFWNEYMQYLYDFIGLDNSKPEHSSEGLRDNIRLMQPHGAAYGGNHVGVQRVHILGALSANIGGGWLWSHEIGHQIDQSSREWTESTNNVIAMEMKSKYNIKGGNSVPYEGSIYPNVTAENPRDFNEGGFFDKLGVFWQLQLSDSEFWAKQDKLYRERKPKPANGQDKQDIYASYASEVLGYDLSPHFEKHGFSISDSVKENLKNTYKPLDKNIWYLNEKSYKYKGNGLSNEAKPKVIYSSFDKKNTDGIDKDIYKIMLAIDEKYNEDLLGYEISRDGKLIGFTSESEFTDTNVEEGESYNYTVTAYGRDGKATPGSNTTISTLKPVIIGDESVTIDLGKEFNPLSYVKGKSFNSSDLSEKIKVIDNNVDINKKGEYSVKYSLSDNEIEVIKEIKVKVVSKSEYLSDMNWQSAYTDYREVRKDKSASNSTIKLKSYGEITEYEKGIGTHANSTIIYSIDGLGYDNFESYIGVDKNIAETTKGSITFEILVDNVKAYDSGLINARDAKKYVSVPVTNAKELKIIVTNAGNGNQSDHASLGDAKLTTNNSKPNLIIGNELEFVKLNSEFDLLEGIVANDIEDGDLIDKVKIDSNEFDIKKTGESEVTYSITDSNNNVITKTKKIIVYSGEVYTSDIEWKSAISGWKNVNKDSAVNTSNKIKLNVNGEIKEFDKGIGAATNAEIVYDLSHKDYAYFSSYVGTDKNYDDNRTTIEFKMFADGVEVYTSDVIRKNSEAQYIFIPLEGVKELKLVADNVEGNGIGDFASWGDAKFYQTNSKPVLDVESSVSTKLGLPIENINGEFKATDNEDGDLTSNVIIEGAVNFNKAGVYPITYTVTDCDSNITTKTRKIKVVDMDDNIYLSDIDWKSAVNSYGKATKDLSASGKTLRLTGENGEVVSYEKGIGTHSTSTIVYDLTQDEYGYFTTFVGVDRQAYGTAGSVTFEMWLDNEKVYDTGVMNSRDPQRFIEVNLKDAKELKIVVTDSGNGNGYDHATLGDSKLYKVSKDAIEVSRNELDTLIEEIKTLDQNIYTKESFSNLIAVQDNVLESLKNGYNQAEIDRLLNELKEAKKALVEIVNYDVLEKTIKEAKEVKGYLYTKESYTNFKNSLEKAEKIVEDKISSILEVSEMITELKGNIESLQMFEGKAELEKLVDEAYKITDISMIGGTEDREYRWGDFVENRIYAREVLFDINATNQDVNSVSMFLKLSFDDLMIVNYEGLNDAIKETKDLKEYMYTKESFTSLKNTIEKANKMIIDKNSTQVQVKEIISEIKNKVDLLEVFKGKDKLEKLVEQANKITDISMIGGMDNREYRWAEFVENRMYAIEVLFDIDAHQQDVNSMNIFLEKSIIDLDI